MASANGSSTTHFERRRVTELNATHAEVTNSAVRYLDADQARLERAAAHRVRAKQVEVVNSVIGFGTFDQGTIRQSNAGIVIGQAQLAQHRKALGRKGFVQLNHVNLVQ